MSGCSPTLAQPTEAMTPVRVAILAPIAWRTPPRHYGPWEPSRRCSPRDSSPAATTSRCSLRATHARRPGSARWSDGLVGGRHDRPQGGGVPAHLAGVRARRRVRPHPQRLRLPAAHLRRAGHHSSRHDDPRLLLGAHRPGLRQVRRPRPTSRSATPTGIPSLHYAATVHHGIDTDAFALHPDPATTSRSSAASTPTRGRGGHRDRCGPGMAAAIAGIVQDEVYFERAGRAPHRRRPGRYLGPVAPRTARRSSAARSPCST